MQRNNDLSEESLASYLKDEDRVEAISAKVGTIVLDTRLIEQLKILSSAQQIALSMLFDNGLLMEINRIARHLKDHT